MSRSLEEWYGQEPTWHAYERFGAGYNVLATAIFAKVKRAKRRNLAVGDDGTIEWSCTAYYRDAQREEDLPANLKVRCCLGGGAIKAVGFSIGEEAYVYDEAGPARILPDGTYDRMSIPDDHVSEISEKLQQLQWRTSSSH